jgi:opacity protein-like surface antigen
MTSSQRKKPINAAHSVPRGLLLLVVTAALLVSAAAAQGQNRAPGEEEDLLDYTGQPFRLSASTGFDYSQGDYGSGEDSDTLYIPAAVKLELDPFIFRMSIPWVRSSCDLVDDICQGGSQPEQKGIGDLIVSAAYVFYPEASSSLPALELTGKIKFGTADRDKGLGTGENDYTLQADISKSMGRFYPFAGVGYRFVGNPPGSDLSNKWLAYAGVSTRINSKFSLGVSYDWSQSTVRTRADAHELSPFASFKISKSFAIDPYGVIGLSDNSPDWGIGMQIRFIYDRF